MRRAEDFNVKSMTSHSHVTQASQQSRVERHANEQFGRFVAESKQEENVSEAEESEIQVSNQLLFSPKIPPCNVGTLPEIHHQMPFPSL